MCDMDYMAMDYIQFFVLSGDIELNSEPNTSIFNFCSWNPNSICAHEFVRVTLTEAYNSVYNYGLRRDRNKDNRMDKCFRQNGGL